jgi:hypothetical protein
MIIANRVIYLTKVENVVLISHDTEKEVVEADPNVVLLKDGFLKV